MSLTPGGIIARTNATFLRWTGHEASGFAEDTRFHTLLTVGSQIYYESHCVPRLLADRSVAQVALDVRRADGSILPTLFSAEVHAHDASGKPRLVRATLVDVSLRRQFERRLMAKNTELERSIEAYDAFAHAAAHDLRAPLRHIRLNTEFFLEDVGEQLPAEASAQLETVIHLAERMSSMLDDLLGYSQAGRSDLHPGPVPLRAAVAEAVELLGGRVERANITTADASIVVDPAALRQILLNLIGNAVKYSPTAADITIGTLTLEEAARRAPLPPTLTGAPPDTPVLMVADRGIGIDPAHHDGVFGLFRQVDPQADGSGTGLALCRLLCRRHGGDIWVTSELGEGSAFYVVVGVERAD